MTGGIGFTSDMMKRYKVNRGQLKNNKKWGLISSEAKTPHDSLPYSKTEEVKDQSIQHERLNKTTSTAQKKEDIQIGLTKIIIYVIGISGFLYLILKYLK
jgi:hypothetical protein